MVMSLLETGQHPLTAFTMSLWTGHPTPCSCLSSFSLKKTLCPSSVVVSPSNLQWCTSSIPDIFVLVYGGRRGPCSPERWPIRYRMAASCHPWWVMGKVQLDGAHPSPGRWRDLWVHCRSLPPTWPLSSYMEIYTQSCRVDTSYFTHNWQTHGGRGEGGGVFLPVQVQKTCPLPSISLSPNIRLMSPLVTSIFLCACESWTLTAELQIIQVMGMRCYHKVLPISYKDCHQRESSCQDPAGNRTTRRPPDQS